MPKKKDETIPWNCPNGHLLGHVEHYRSGLKLILYEKSLDPRWPTHQPAPEYRGTLEGKSTIRCTVCHVDREWRPDKEALFRMLKNVKELHKESPLLTSTTKVA